MVINRRRRSLYWRVTVTLSIVCITLFVLLGVFNALYLRGSVLDRVYALYQPRINQLFFELGEQGIQPDDREAVTEKLNAFFTEFSVDMFAGDSTWLGGTQSRFDAYAQLPQRKTMHDDSPFHVFTRFYFNPDTTSPFAAMKFTFQPPGPPLFYEVVILFTLSGVLVLVVSGILSWRMVSYLKRRLDRLKWGVTRIAAGDFQYRLDDQGHDEIAFLAKNFNRGHLPEYCG